MCVLYQDWCVILLYLFFLVYPLPCKKIFYNGVIIFEDMEIFCRFNKLLVICLLILLIKQINYLFQISNRRIYVLNHIFFISISFRNSTDSRLKIRTFIWDILNYHSYQLLLFVTCYCDHIAINISSLNLLEVILTIWGNISRFHLFHFRYLFEFHQTTNNYLYH